MIDYFMVEIKIDTSKSSKEDIKRAIEFLKNYVEEPVTNSSQEMDIPIGTMDIFTQEEPEIKRVETKQDNDEDDDTDFQIKPIFY